MFAQFERLSLRLQFFILMSVFIAVVLIAGTIIGRSIVISQTVNESRSVADMVEHIGKWASQYSGVHIKRQGPDAATVGSYLQRTAYAASDDDKATLDGTHLVAPQGSRMSSVTKELAALNRMEVYHWKNPALIQREVSDIAAASTSTAKFRMTSRTVLNKDNKASGFEVEAMNAIDAAYKDNATDDGDRSRREFWRVDGGQLLYARTVVAQKSCLKCHGSFEKAPDFLRTNNQFNGGGGFGYVEGKPAGVISVAIPLPGTTQALSSSMTLAGWQALGAIGLSGFLVFVFVGRRIIKPVNDLKRYADELANQDVTKSYEVPAFANVRGRTWNEVHRLGNSIAVLGKSLKFMYTRSEQGRK